MSVRTVRFVGALKDKSKASQGSIPQLNRQQCTDMKKEDDSIPIRSPLANIFNIGINMNDIRTQKIAILAPHTGKEHNTISTDSHSINPSITNQVQFESLTHQTPLTESDDSLRIHTEEKNDRGRSVMSEALNTLWEEPKELLRKPLSDASLQKTKTSALFSTAMVPASHAKTAEIARYDFLEDSMTFSTIEEFKLYTKDWTGLFDREELEQLIHTVLNRYYETSASILINDSIGSSVKNTLEMWSQLPQPSFRVAEDPKETREKNSYDAAAVSDSYWSTYRYLTWRHMQHNSLESSTSQTLFPSSIARYISSKGADHESFKSCKFDVHKILVDYDILKKGPWGR